MYKKCYHCKLIKLTVFFYNDKYKKDQLTSYCIECLKEKNKIKLKKKQNIRYNNYKFIISNLQDKGWKIIKDYPNYLINKNGDIYSIKQNIYKKPHYNNYVILSNKNFNKCFKIDDLINQTFV